MSHLYCSQQVALHFTPSPPTSRRFKESNHKSAFQCEFHELNGYVISLQKLDELLKQEIARGTVVIEKANIVGADEKTFDI